MWFHKAIVTVFGLGYMPKAPGTFGALGAVAMLFIFKWLDMPLPDYVIVVMIILLSLIGTYSTHVVIKDWGDDPSRVVIDEFIGLLVGMLFIPHTWINILLVFGFFRFFDIKKPLGISYADKNIPGAWGVLLDDILAGIYTCLSMQLLLLILGKINL